MTAGPNDLTTLTNALAWLNLQSDDAFGTIQRLITAISTSVQNHIGRTIASASYTVTLDGRGRNRIPMANYPITAVSSVNLIYGCAGVFVIPPRSFAGVGASGTPGFSFNDRYVYVDKPYLFEKGVQNVQISYTAGYTSTPSDIEQATLLWLQSISNSQNYAAMFKSMKAGQTTLDFSFMLTAFKDNSIVIPPGVTALLSPHRRVTPSW
jgi:hypothetical protein